MQIIVAETPFRDCQPPPPPGERHLPPPPPARRALNRVAYFAADFFFVPLPGFFYLFFHPITTAALHRSHTFFKRPASSPSRDRSTTPLTVPVRSEVETIRGVSTLLSDSHVSRVSL